MVEDTLFYEVEPCNSGKRIHVLGWIFCDRIEDDEGNMYRLSEGKNIYFSVDELKGADPENPESLGKVLQLVYNEKTKRQDVVIGYEKACECFDTFIKEFSPTELDLFTCNQGTPCGNYWCDMSDL